MRAVQSIHLIIAVVALTILGDISIAFGLAGYQSFETGIAVAYLLILANISIAIAGLFTRHRAAWLGYLIVSIALTILIGVVTPLSVFGLLTRL